MSDRDPGDGATRAADAAAREALWLAHRRFVAAVLLAHKPAAADLDDLLQEVALRFCRNLADLRDPARVRPWLRSIALHVARSAGRRQRVLRTALDRIRPADPERDAAGVRPGEELEDALDRVLRLPEPYREPLLLKAVRGLSQRDIAAVLGLPETTVETRLVRARRMLRGAEDRPVDSACRDGARIGAGEEHLP